MDFIKIGKDDDLTASVKTSINKVIDQFESVYKKNNNVFLQWIEKLEIDKEDCPDLMNFSKKIKKTTKTISSKYNVIIYLIVNNIEYFKSNNVNLDELVSKIKTQYVINWNKENNKYILGNGDNNVTINDIFNLKPIDLDYLELWKKNPIIDPNDNSEIEVSILPNSKYCILYVQLLKKLIKENSSSSSVDLEKIKKQLPKNHIYKFKCNSFKQTHIPQNCLVYIKKNYGLISEDYDYLFNKYFFENVNLDNLSDNMFNEYYLKYLFLDELMVKPKNINEILLKNIEVLLKNYILEVGYYIPQITGLCETLYSPTHHFLYYDEPEKYFEKFGELNKKRKNKFVENSIKLNEFKLKIIICLLLNNDTINLKEVLSNTLKLLSKDLLYIREGIKMDWNWRPTEKEKYILDYCDNLDILKLNFEVEKKSDDEILYFMISMLNDVIKYYKESIFHDIKYEYIYPDDVELPEVPLPPKKIPQYLEKYKSRVSKDNSLRDSKLDVQLEEFNKKIKLEELSYKMKLNLYKKRYLTVNKKLKSINSEGTIDKTARSSRNRSLRSFSSELLIDKYKKKYPNCDLDDVDILTYKPFNEMTEKELKYLSVIESEVNGKKICHCYDTVALYNYILKCNKDGVRPLNLRLGRTVFLTEKNLEEVYKNIKFFTYLPTLEINKRTSLIFDYEFHKNNDTDLLIFKKKISIKLGGLNLRLKEFNNLFYRLGYKDLIFDEEKELNVLNNKYPFITEFEDNNIGNLKYIYYFKYPDNIDLPSNQIANEKTKKLLKILKNGIEFGKLLNSNIFPYKKPTKPIFKIKRVHYSQDRSCLTNHYSLTNHYKRKEILDTLISDLENI
jgi:hypothetical protein